MNSEDVKSSDINNPVKVLEEARKQLVSILEHAPEHIQTLIEAALDNLNTALVAKPDDLSAIDTFEKECHAILNDNKYSILQSALATFALTVTATFLAFITGFALGVQLGFWGGPGALVTGALAGTIAAVAVAGGMAVTGSGVAACGIGVTIGLFAHNNKLDTIANEVHEWCDALKTV